MNTDRITPDLTRVLRRLKLGQLLDTLPERLSIARQQQMPHQDFLLLVLSDEVSRRDSAAVTIRATQARLDPTMTIEQWDPSAKVSYDRSLWNALVSMRFVADHRHVAIVGPVGVGKTFLAHALGWVACRHGYTVLAISADKMLKRLKQARLDHTYEQELRKLLAVDVLLLDDFGLDSLDPVESRDTYEILIERHRSCSIIVTSNRGPDEWLATFADPLRALPPWTASPAPPTTLRWKESRTAHGTETRPHQGWTGERGLGTTATVTPQGKRGECSRETAGGMVLKINTREPCRV